MDIPIFGFTHERKIIPKITAMVEEEDAVIRSSAGRISNTCISHIRRHSACMVVLFMATFWQEVGQVLEISQPVFARLERRMTRSSDVRCSGLKGR